MIRLRTTLTTMVLLVAVSACSPPGAAGSPSPSASAVSSPTWTATPEPSPAPSATPAPTVAPSSTPIATPDPPDGGSGGGGGGSARHDLWVNGLILPGSDGSHFGPDWGPTWFWAKTIGERFTDWRPTDVAVDPSCPWAAELTTYPDNVVYASAVGDPHGDSSVALEFRMSNPDDPSVPGPRNAEGISVGTPMDDVLAAYPGTSEAFFNDEAWGDVYEIDVYQPTTDTHMFFWSWTPHGNVEYVQWGYFADGHSWRGHTCAG